MTKRVWVWWGVCLCACSSGSGARDASAVPDDAAVDIPLVDPDYGRELPRDPGGRDDEALADQAPGDVGDPGETGPDLPGPDLVDVPCVPDCRNRVCGSDGCGDVCGYCLQGYLCTVEGTCELFCRTDCAGKACGADGCGGECPPGCAENEECGPFFTCVLKSCVPKCQGKVCGPDGCGSLCGQCDEGFLCTPEGQCTEDRNCYDVTATGRCVGNERQWCEGGILQKEYCDPQTGVVCGYDSVGKKFLCRPPEVCQPQCTGKECGRDGCGGTCGDCPGGQVCSTGGQCGESCGDVTEAGICADAYQLVFCHQGILVRYDCFSLVPPKRCGWNPEQQMYDCYL
ncbi:hypothetical protein KBD49_02175 [Myxococcota bacterium]|jgi:hypothetical protein|nr:hypothetical protein [Myxococcota bacterium]